MKKPVDYVRDTIDLVKQIETRFLELGSRLYKIKEEKLWEGSYDSYLEFLDVAHINPSMASRLTKIYEVYIVSGKQDVDSLTGIGYSNLYEAIPLIEKDGMEKTLVKASTLTRAEIIDEKKEQQFGHHTHELGHDRWGVCTKCNKFMKADHE